MFSIWSDAPRTENFSQDRIFVRTLYFPGSYSSLFMTVERGLLMDHFIGLQNVYFWKDRSIALRLGHFHPLCSALLDHSLWSTILVANFDWPLWPPIFDRLIFARIERNLEKLTMSNQCAMVFVNLVLVQISMAKQKCHGNVLAPRQRVAGGSFKWVLF